MNEVSVGSPMPVASGQPPQSWVIDTRSASSRPSSSNPTSTSCSWARPWTIEVMFSLRVSTYLTGRRSRFDSSAVSRNSG
jgi:hypothetical protein